MVSKLRAIGVISDSGMQVGKLHDILFDENDGKIQSIVVRPISKEALVNISRDSSGNAVIPFGAVMSIHDFIVINERVLAVQQLKARPKVETTPE
jgi:sporulation protein YlmC with PRC-barrel domain